MNAVAGFFSGPVCALVLKKYKNNLKKIVCKFDKVCMNCSYFQLNFKNIYLNFMWFNKQRAKF